MDFRTMPAALLDLQYLPNISWFVHYLRCERVYIEKEENFIKSTYRNRCEIAGVGGKLALTIPLLGGRDHHQLYRETKISYAEPWQHNHWQSMLSAYGSAPFFDFYAPKLQSFFEKECELLFDFNIQLLDGLLSALKIPQKHQLTSIYQKQPLEMTDLRSKKLKLQTHINSYPRYYQVFEDRNGFIGNLSILDLIFHEGPVAKTYLLNLVE